ncbi:MAG: gliding motility-associated C-terminal domain-containing protein [Bacteroidia bacterium]|nr:gliding motility-associated C-terminal domain-containing protein [Bacteroidia bacterium]
MNKLLFFSFLSSLLLLNCSFDFKDESPASDDGECVVYIPESISPNGDGINDLFLIETACKYASYSLKIYDNHKRLVFQTIDPRKVWDGSENGIPLPQGHYSWVLQFKIADNGSTVQEKGAIALIR